MCVITIIEYRDTTAIPEVHMKRCSTSPSKGGVKFSRTPRRLDGPVVA